MLLAHKFRKFITSGGRAAALVSGLAMLPFNGYAGQAESAKATPISNAASAEAQERINQSNRNIDELIKRMERMAEEAGKIARAERSTAVFRAGHYSAQNHGVGVAVYLGTPQEGNHLTGDEIARTIKHFFEKRMIPVQVFIEEGLKPETRVIYVVDKKFYGPYYLDEAPKQAANAAGLYKLAQDEKRGTVEGPSITRNAPAYVQE